MQQWTIGNTTITRVEELLGPLFDPTTFFPDFDPAFIDKHRKWMLPGHFNVSANRIISSMHSWLVRTPHHTVLIDSCIGNGKDRMPFRDWHEMDGPWMHRLTDTGVRPEDIDFVMCTHLHVDHVGWNTRLENGQWVPTFPNAKYIFSQQEFDFWHAERDRNEGEAFARVNNKTFDDSVLPVMHLAHLIEGSEAIIPDLLQVEPAPGHTPGSITVSLTDKGQEALFTGDILHHPLQVYEPHWNSAYCELPEQARATRLSVLEHCANRGSLMMPAHFGPSFAGEVRNDGDGFEFVFT
jgi:glyoxylase-like metal-dependent hydrolase (beta-lactamase superfamily II)